VAILGQTSFTGGSPGAACTTATETLFTSSGGSGLYRVAYGTTQGVEPSSTTSGNYFISSLPGTSPWLIAWKDTFTSSTAATGIYRMVQIRNGTTLVADASLRNSTVTPGTREAVLRNSSTSVVAGQATGDPITAAATWCFELAYAGTTMTMRVWKNQTGNGTPDYTWTQTITSATFNMFIGPDASTGVVSTISDLKITDGALVFGTAASTTAALALSASGTAAGAGSRNRVPVADWHRYSGRSSHWCRCPRALGHWWSWCDDAGTAALSLSASGTAATTAAGTASLSLTASGTARATAAGTASLSLSASGAVSAPASGTASLSLSASGATTSPASGTAALSLSASGSARAPAVGSAALSLTATGTATGPNGASGTAAISLSASGSATGATTGTASLTLTGTGVAASRAAGAASLSLSANATATARVVGAASLTLSGLGALSGVATAQALLTLTAIGTATGAVARDITASATLARDWTAGPLVARGTATLEPRTRKAALVRDRAATLEPRTWKARM
jgi:hypothetical protein